MMRNPNWKENSKGGVAISMNSGKTWTPKYTGMGFDSPTTCLVLDEDSPVDSRILYASVFGKGVFKSIDGGDHWVLKNNGLTGSLAAFEITLLPNGDLYLITSPVPHHEGGKTGREVNMGAVYVSKDGAETWSHVSVGDKVLYPNGLCYDPGNLQILYLAAWADVSLNALVGRRVAQENGGNAVFDLDGGIFKSVDGGQTWAQIFDENQYVYDVTVDVRHPGRVYCNTFNRERIEVMMKGKPGTD
ncbi:MAG: exo-alpha-sialidase [Saprospiraceae bacterium]|nr:exo-alpha-sialidase [Saprospiraceae bacterium]